MTTATPTKATTTQPVDEVLKAAGFTYPAHYNIDSVGTVYLRERMYMAKARKCLEKAGYCTYSIAGGDSIHFTDDVDWEETTAGINAMKEARQTPEAIKRLASAWKILSFAWDKHYDKHLARGPMHGYNIVFATSDTGDFVFMQIEPSVPGWVRGEIEDFITKLRKADWRITKRYQYREARSYRLDSGPGAGSEPGADFEMPETRIEVYEIWVD